MSQPVLPAPQPRTPLHTRQVTFHGFKRDDGLWDIEASLKDSRAYDSEGLEERKLPAGAAVHHMAVRVTVDDDLVVRDIASSMGSVPFAECQGALEPLESLIGCTLGPGWRRSIEDRLGGVKSCTHMRELLFNVATAAYQTIPVYRVFQQPAARQTALSEKPFFHMGKCTGWDFDGAVMKRNYPQFVGWARKLAGKDADAAADSDLAVKKPGSGS